MAYSEEEIEYTFNKITAQVESGEPIRSVLLQIDMPSSKTFFKWLDESPEKVKQYARACEARADKIFEDIIDIADENEADVYIDPLGVAKIDGNTVQRSRLKVEARKWMLGKLNPKKYGESSLLKLADNDGDKLKINAIFTQDLLSVPANNSAKSDS